MSDIPVGKRSKSKLEAQHNAYKIRKTLTMELMRNFGVTQEMLDQYVLKSVAHIKDDTKRMREAQALKQRIADFIHDERKDVKRLLTGISGHLRAANTIVPMHYAEWCERRVELDRAMAYCNRLQDELQYIATALPTDKNKYMGIVLEIEKEFGLIKALRQSDNRFLDNLPDVPGKLKERREQARAKGKKK